MTKHDEMATATTEPVASAITTTTSGQESVDGNVDETTSVPAVGEQVQDGTADGSNAAEKEEVIQHEFVEEILDDDDYSDIVQNAIEDMVKKEVEVTSTTTTTTSQDVSTNIAAENISLETGTTSKPADIGSRNQLHHNSKSEQEHVEEEEHITTVLPSTTTVSTNHYQS